MVIVTSLGSHREGLPGPQMSIELCLYACPCLGVTLVCKSSPSMDYPKTMEKGIQGSPALVPGWLLGTFVKWTPVCPRNKAT